MDLEILSGGLLVFSATAVLLGLLMSAGETSVRLVNFFRRLDLRWLNSFLLDHVAVFFGFKEGAAGAYGEDAWGAQVLKWVDLVRRCWIWGGFWVVLIFFLVVSDRASEPVSFRSGLLQSLTFLGIAPLLLFNKVSKELVSVLALVGAVALTTTWSWLGLKFAGLGVAYYYFILVLTVLLAGVLKLVSERPKVLQGFGFAVYCAVLYRFLPGFIDVGEVFRNTAPYIGVGLGFLMTLAGWAVLVDVQAHLARLNLRPIALRAAFLFYALLCFSAFLLYYGIRWLDVDLNLFDAASDSTVWQYLYYLLNITLQQIPGIGEFFAQLLQPNGLHGMPTAILHFVLDLTVTQTIKMMMAGALLLVGVSSVLFIARNSRRRLAERFGRLAARKADEGTFPAIVSVVGDARERGPDFLNQAQMAADKVLSVCYPRAEFSPFRAAGSLGMGAPFLGYLLNNSDERAAVRRSFFDAGSIAIKEYLDWLTRPIWPVLLNSQAVSASRSLKDIVQGLRQSESEWSPERGPLNFAALLGELGVELSRLVEEKWLDDQADLAELAELLDEAASIMHYAAQMFGSVPSSIDLAAVLQNEGIALWMLARLRGDKTKAQKAVECFKDAIDASFQRPETDLAASHLFCATATALLYDLTRDDRYCFKAMEHYRIAIGIFAANASRILFARENLILSLFHAANAAMLFGQWNQAVSYLYRAKREWSDTGMRFPNGAALKRKIIKRYAFAAVNLAKVVNSRCLPQEPNDRNVTSSLRRAKTAIMMLVKEGDLKDLVTKAARSKDAKIAARNDVLSVMLLAAYAAWMQLEVRQPEAGGQLAVAEGLASFVSDIANMLQRSVDWAPPDGLDEVVPPNAPVNESRAKEDKLKAITAEEVKSLREEVEALLSGI